MIKAKKTKKYSWFDHKGLPIAAASLVLLLAFLLLTINLTRVEEDEGTVQGVAKIRPKTTATKATAKATKEETLVNALILQVDALLKSNNRFSDNLADIK